MLKVQEFESLSLPKVIRQCKITVVEIYEKSEEFALNGLGQALIKLSKSNEIDEKMISTSL